MRLRASSSRQATADGAGLPAAQARAARGVQQPSSGEEALLHRPAGASAAAERCRRPCLVAHTCRWASHAQAAADLCAQAVTHLLVRAGRPPQAVMPAARALQLPASCRLLLLLPLV